MAKEKGCSTCQYRGSIEIRNCLDAYSEKAEMCNLYNHKKYERNDALLHTYMVALTLQDYKKGQGRQNEQKTSKETI